jgi:hypothetical protein
MSQQPLVWMAYPFLSQKCLAACPIVKCQLGNDWQLDEYGWQVGTPEVKEGTTYVQYTPRT